VEIWGLIGEEESNEGRGCRRHPLCRWLSGNLGPGQCSAGAGPETWGSSG